MDRAKYEEVQRIQAAYRAQIASHWPIRLGDSLLEVGCGQGDMTVILAEAVGEEGRVTAVDAAARSYGAPLTLGEATDLIKASPLGPRIDFRFELDVQATEMKEFSAAVLAHSLWYFGSEDLIRRTLTTVRDWADTLYLAEWDLTPDRVEQIPHMLAVMIQGEVEAFKPQSQANVRTPISRQRLKTLLEEVRWRIVSEHTLDTSELHDADWEIEACLKSDPSILPDRLRTLVQGQTEVLRERAQPSGNRPLAAYALQAHRV